MREVFFITNDLNRPAKASSTYCYIPGNIGNARYKGATNNVSYHYWWQYSTAPENRNALLSAKTKGDTFKVIQGKIGEQNITIENQNNDESYDLVFPEIGMRTVELVPMLGNELFTIGHFGHWIEDSNEFRPRTDAPVYTLQEEQEKVLIEYNQLRGTFALK